jgi:acyl-CoA thioesterase-2
MTSPRMPMLDAIELTEAEGPADRTSFQAVTQPVPWPKAYGGDLAAAALAAMDRTVADDRAVHSFHSYFMRPADIGAAVRYDVETLRDGRGYSTREVRAVQNDKTIFIGLASYHVGEDFGQLQASIPEVPDPEQVPSSANALAGRTGPAAAYWAGEARSFEMRHIGGPIYYTVEGAPVPHQALWLKALAPLPDDPALHRVALAYACDYTILEPILRGHGLAWQDPGVVTASLDHAMWFHRDGRADEWVLYAQETESAQSGRGLARGRFFSRDGVHLATVLQEGMIRVSAGA